MLWCDLRIAGESAIFGVFNRRFGIPLVDLGTIRLPRIIGHGRAMATAVEIAQKLSSFPQTALRQDRLSAIANEIAHGLLTVASGETGLGGPELQRRCRQARRNRYLIDSLCGSQEMACVDPWGSDA